MRVAKNLQRFGAERGQKLQLFIDNYQEIAPLSFGSIFLGCTVVPIAITSSQAECEYFLNITRPEFAVCHIEFYSALKECFTNLKLNAKIFTVEGQIGDSIPLQSLFESVENESSIM